MNTRATVITALTQDPPQVDVALDALSTIDEATLTPDALTLRTALIEAANWIEAGKIRPYDLANFLRDAADGRLSELDDHDIDFDLPDDDANMSLAALALPLRPAAPALPGPDTALLDVLRLRDALVARRIAGDTPSAQDTQAYQDALIALGQALQPLVDAHPRTVDTTL